MFIRICLLWLCSCPFLLFGQSEALDSLRALQGMIEEVQVGKDNYRQTLDFDEAQPYRIKVNLTKLGSKGREESIRFDINLALIDPNLVRYEDGKDQIKVNLRSNKEKVVKVFEDDELDGYEKEAFILAINIDNARAMEQLFRSVIPLLKAQWEEDSTLPDDYDALFDWAKQHTANVVVDDNTLDQTWSAYEGQPTLVNFDLKEDDDAFHYCWNLADIHAPSISTEVKGKLVYIEMGTAKGVRYVQVEKNGELENYEDEIRIYFSEIDDAQVMAHALRKLVEMAKKKEEGQLPVYENPEAILEDLQKNMPAFQAGDEKVTQTLSGDCQAKLEMIIDEGKGEETIVYAFNFNDLQAQAVEINVRGKSIQVTAKTNKSNDYIYVSENGEQQNYEDELSIAVPDLLQAKRIRYQLAELAKQCPETIEPQTFDWIKQQLERISSTSEDFEQYLELLEESSCKWAFTQREAKGKNTDEQRFEFNLYDLDPQRIELSVKGKNVAVSVPTNRNEEIIKNYRNNEELGYEEELTFLVSDILVGKQLKESLKEIIQSCKNSDN